MKNPEPDPKTASNVARWIGELGLASYEEFHAFSVREREAFLGQVLARLNLRFRRAPSSMIDLSDGIEKPVWFPGAKLNIVDSAFQAERDSPAIVSRREGDDEIHSLTVGELDHLSGRVANGLLSMGLHAGDPVAIAMPMTPECVASYLGVIRAGMVVVSIADSFSTEEIRLRLNIAGARAVVTQDVILRAGKRLPLYPRVAAAADCPLIVCRADPAPKVELREADQWFDGFLSTQSSFETVASTPQDSINVLFSSGTTGRPKAIPWDHSTPIRSALDGYVHLDLQHGDRMAWPTSIGWMMGPWLIFATLINRATMALFDGAPQSSEFGRFVEEARVTQLGVVPSLVRTWRATGCMDGLNWGAIKAFGSTGEASNAGDMAWLADRAGGSPVIEYCGGTETGGSYITSTLIDPAPPGCFSAKTIGSDFVILDALGNETESGEVFLVPPVLGHSTRLINADHHEVYFEGCPRGPSGQVLRRHGDMIERLPNGRYRAMGRADDSMNLGGIKVSPVELEQVMNQSASVVETAAVALNPEEGGPSHLVVYVVPEVEGNVDIDALREDLQSRIRQDLNPLFRISDLRIIDALPRTASNKVMRRVLRERYRKD